ncbi:hypothetical protein Acin_1930 [Acidaminococcus intestini RyC-MR95]|uniref:Uncharacterized protein n=1 Tax=Acidaminococcus intestini (strain RyC-MR95) TaxID=568816 RepID=G4Q4F3_ACIIR|nr:hypothetical protein Acin_1930 [Acidaminococcus intestini RyC-MR95]
MLLTVPAVRQVRAAWEGTGSFRFSRHSCHLLSDMKKALQDRSCKACLYYSLFS